MIAASWPRADATSERLLVVPIDGQPSVDATVGRLAEQLRAGDLLVVNDAATLPASLPGHTANGAEIELRLAAPTDDPARFAAVIFGAGDWTTKTEHRPPPPRVDVGAVLRLGSDLFATVEAVSTLSPRLLSVRLGARSGRLWPALYAEGRPIQYAHIERPLSLFHVQTSYAGRPWAVEQPSAGRPLRWHTLRALDARGVTVARLTHAAGLSSTGDEAIDASLPLPERYELPQETVDAVERTRHERGRVVAVGTSVVRALEGNHATFGRLVAGVATTALHVDHRHALRVVDGVLSGVHERGTSHFSLLSAFVEPARLDEANALAERLGYLGHELGDSCLVWKQPSALSATQTAA